MSETNSSSSAENWSKYAKHYDPLKIGSIDGTDIEPHDRAIIRAINSEYTPNKHVKDFECERLLKGWKPRRLGGGFGGNKESGQLRFGGRDRPFKKPISLQFSEKDRDKRAGSHSFERYKRRRPHTPDSEDDIRKHDNYRKHPSGSREER
ncbi:hypothetical protein QE152_g31050 [Popillia japonica]|uniref:Uncharacterized protein n=1 Tax=Popillia japonica TaxID=7064 RepID=A0AAW1JCG0_POPJA